MTGVNGSVLSIDRGKLTEGVSYTFRASGVAGGGAANLTADADVVVNAAPRGGTLEVAPIADADEGPFDDIGVGKFLARAVGFADDPDHYPLTYEFFKKVPNVTEDVTDANSSSATVLVPLGATQTANNIVVILGPGSHEIEARVTDRHGAAAVATDTVTVAPAPVPSPPPPPPSPPPEMLLGRRLLAGVEADAGDETYYLSHQPPYTRGYNATTAARFFETLVAPSVAIGAHSQIVQAADAYARTFAVEPSGVLPAAGIDPAASNACGDEDPDALDVATRARARRRRLGDGARRDSANRRRGEPAVVRVGDIIHRPAAGSRRRWPTPDARARRGRARELALSSRDESRDGPVADPDSGALRCATELVSNLLAARVGGCGVQYDDISEAAAAAAVDDVVSAVGVALVPGAVAVTADARHLSLAVAAADPSTGVGFPLVAAINSRGKSAAKASLAAGRVEGWTFRV